MAALVCTTAYQLEQLVQILVADEGRYNAVVPTGPANFPPYIRLFQSYALGELQGVTDYYLYLDPDGKQPQTIGILTGLAAMTDAMIANAFQFQYTVQALNTVTVLLELRQNLLYNDAIGYARGLYVASIGHANAVGVQAEANLVSAYNRLILHSDQGTQSALNAVARETLAREGQIGAVQTALQGNINSERADRLAQVGTVQTALQGNINAVQSQVTALVGADVTSLTKQIADAANKAEQEVHNAVSQAETFATTVAAGAGTAAVAKVVAQLQPQIDAIKTETAECLAPLCDTVTPNAKNLGKLGNLLGGATDAALTGLLAAFLAEAAHNPRQAAADVAGALGGIVGSAATGVRDLVGV